MTNSDIALVRLYYETYGLSEEEIARDLNMSPVVVKSLVSEKQYVPAVQKMDQDKRAILMERDIDRQLLLAPLYARTEVCLLGKIYDCAQRIDVEEDGDLATKKLADLSKAYSTLKSSAAQWKMDDLAGQQGVAIQILNSL